MNMNTTKVAMILLVLVVVVVAGEVQVSTAAITCNPVQLSPCANAITSSTKPSDTCCARIKQQRPCLCGYMKNPYLQKFINSPGAKKVANSCQTPFPNC
ncbi:hypothetical protein RD792_015444 [Penstemon davidsonii]|uniref:Bifunctional inhibitor/plant lipid transfer protein/seed storage helical domain-containing protein n=1 Tax=Penstemon davidsonii TaxID=160366 RepID=A0ABR0CSM6_9LAMI|nr:hypothetical protein RD792_015444 [Penstemon davidsonii]